MRLFVALTLGDGARGALAEWARRAVGDDPALRLVRDEALHLTLAFLGERPDPAPFATAVESVPAEVGPLRCGGALWLAPRRPHVLTVAVEGEVATLHDALWDALGLERERRAFRPHVTVARVRHRMRPRTLELEAPPECDLGPHDLVLFRSMLGGRRPAKYERLTQVAVTIRR